MDATGTFFLAVGCALLLTVRALECYEKYEATCSPDGPICDALLPSSENVEMTPTKCDSDVTMCSLVTFTSSVQGFDFESVLSGCLPKEETTVNLQNDCYDRKELEKISSEYAELLKQLEESAEVTLDSVKLCLCNEDLCNSSIKSVFSISVIIWSVVTGFVLSI